MEQLQTDKRYWLFMGNDYEFGLGMDCFIASFDTTEEAMDFIIKSFESGSSSDNYHGDEAQLYDTVERVYIHKMYSEGEYIRKKDFDALPESINPCDVCGKIPAKVEAKGGWSICIDHIYTDAPVIGRIVWVRKITGDH